MHGVQRANFQHNSTAFLVCTVNNSAIPFRIQVNLGTREVIQFDNIEKMQRGLTYRGIKKEISDEYERRTVDCKKQLIQENVEQIPILDDKDPLKLRTRVYKAVRILLYINLVNVIDFIVRTIKSNGVSLKRKLLFRG